MHYITVAYTLCSVLNCPKFQKRMRYIQCTHSWQCGMAPNALQSYDGDRADNTRILIHIFRNSVISSIKYTWLTVLLLLYLWHCICIAREHVRFVSCVITARAKRAPRGKKQWFSVCYICHANCAVFLHHAQIYEGKYTKWKCFVFLSAYFRWQNDGYLDMPLLFFWR